jgi:hypothetical protein
MRTLCWAICAALSVPLPPTERRVSPSGDAPWFAVGKGPVDFQVQRQAPSEIREFLLTAARDSKPDALVRAILRVLDRTEEVIADQTNNRIETAAASQVGRAKIIHYNPQLFAVLRREAASEWGAVFIFAHEIMHHLLRHDGRLASRQMSSAEAEAEANEGAGLVLARIGATLDEATTAVKAACRLINASAGQVDEVVSAVERGWRRSKNAG